MNLLEIKRIVDHRPFRPIELELVSGTRIPVRHPEEIAFAFDILGAVKLKNGDAVAFGPQDVAAVHFRRNGGKRHS